MQGAGAVEEARVREDSAGVTGALPRIGADGFWIPSP